MKRVKKILSLSVKAAIGIGALWILAWRLRSDLGPEQLELLLLSFQSAKTWLLLLLALLLVPLNWGIESLKWQKVTSIVEPIAFKQASLSVYAGICAGNFAPGRATEFLGKLLYFSDENKARIALLHFLNGMIQLAITLLAGLSALLLKLDAFPETDRALANGLLYGSLVLLLLFAWLAWRSELLIHKINRWFASRFPVNTEGLRLPASLWLSLSLLSILRYLVFCLQFLLLLSIHPEAKLSGSLFSGMALYFMISSLLPMVSFLEGPIRAAIALLVLSGSGLAPSELALSTLMLWFLNIVLPSLAGYLALLNMQFDFKLLFPYKNKT